MKKSGTWLYEVKNGNQNEILAGILLEKKLKGRQRVQMSTRNCLLIFAESSATFYVHSPNKPYSYFEFSFWQESDWKIEYTEDVDAYLGFFDHFS